MSVIQRRQSLGLYKLLSMYSSGKWNKKIVCGDLVNILHIFGEENIFPSR
jgi:hypothetical protein